MELQQQNPAPQVAPKTQPNKPKSGRGGVRPGSGRKPNLLKRLASQVTRATAGDILSHVDAPAMFDDIFKNGSRSLKLQAWKELYDRHFGRPKQDVNISGGLVHAHTRDPRLAALPQEALLEMQRAYDDITLKYLPDVSLDGVQNQTESMPAIEAAEMASEVNPS